ncbi:MAG: response regulator transcription factor [Deltaproteobacteria bacterium]
MRLLLADDHERMRDALRALIARMPDVALVGEATTGLEAVALAAQRSPDVVVMDLNMPELNGIEATRRLLQHDAQVKVVALSAHTDRRYVAAMLEAGAHAYVAKNAAFEELWPAISAVMRGHPYVSPSVAGAVPEGSP